VVFVALLVFAYPFALDIPLLDPDEGLHASIAQEMVEQGHWVTPTLLGKPFLDKPILYFWCEALSLRIFGMHETAVRLPGFLLGLLGAITTGVVAWRMFGRGAGLIAALFYATMLLPLALTQAAAHDIALLPWINLAVLGFWESQRASTRRARAGYTLAVGLLLGLTCLAKGLVGIAMVGVAYGSYLLVAWRLSLSACLRGAAAIAVALLVASAWYIAMEIANPGYLYYYFIQRHLLGFATNTQIHGQQPFWYYLPLLLVGGLPWIIYLPAALHDAWLRRTGPEHDAAPGAVLLLLCWLCGGTLFLSAAHSKLVTYIWPVFPPLAILAAVGWQRLLAGTLSGAARRTLERTFRATCWIGPGLLPLGLVAAQSSGWLHVSPWAWLIVLVSAVAAWWPLRLWQSGRPAQALEACIASMAVQFAVSMTVAVPGVAVHFSARDLAAYFNAARAVPSRLWLLDERVGSLVFYLDRPLRAGLRDGQFQGFRFEDLEELRQARPGAEVAVPQWSLEKLARRIDLSGISFRQAGHYRLYDARQIAPAICVASGRGDRLPAEPRRR
jgi:4-amino-4-deoxy-L-arabinose transferase-like glycosyltransferase